MTESFQKLQEWALANNKSFIIELNDFLNAGLTLEEEVRDLLDAHDIGIIMANNMRRSGCIWSVRFHESTNSAIVYYSDKLEHALEMMLGELEVIDEHNNHE